MTTKDLVAPLHFVQHSSELQPSTFIISPQLSSRLINGHFFDIYACLKHFVQKKHESMFAISFTGYDKKHNVAWTLY